VEENTKIRLPPIGRVQEKTKGSTWKEEEKEKLTAEDYDQDESYENKKPKWMGFLSTT